MAHVEDKLTPDNLVPFSIDGVSDIMAATPTARREVNYSADRISRPFYDQAYLFFGDALLPGAFVGVFSKVFLFSNPQVDSATSLGLSAVYGLMGMLWAYEQNKGTIHTTNSIPTQNICADHFRSQLLANTYSFTPKKSA